MRHFNLAILGAFGLAASASASAMPATTFLAKADALTAKGPLATASSDLALLKVELRQSMLRLKAEHDSALAQHRPQSFCPPPKSSMSSNELVASMHRVPKAELARMQVADALRYVLAHKYPCPR